MKTRSPGLALVYSDLGDNRKAAELLKVWPTKIPLGAQLNRARRRLRADARFQMPRPVRCASCSKPIPRTSAK